jgi:integrase
VASIHKRGHSFRVRYRDPQDGANRSRSFRSKQEAIAFRATVEVGVASGSYVSPAESSRRFGEALRTWLDTKTERADYENVLLGVSRKWIGLPYPDGQVHPATSGRPFAHLPMGSINASDIEELLRQMKKAGRSSSYRRKAYQIIDGTFKLAITQRRLTFNPCTAVTSVPSPSPRRKVKPVSETDIRALLARLPSERDRVLVLWLAYTGTRPVEALGLTVGDVNLQRRRVTVLTAKGHDDQERSRTLGIAAPLYEVLVPYLNGRGADESLFAAEDGGDLNYPSWRLNTWHPACAAAGLGKIRPYDLRHTCASMLLARGATMVDLQVWMGHTKASTTSDIYTHLLDEDQHADRLAALLG